MRVAAAFFAGVMLSVGVAHGEPGAEEPVTGAHEASRWETSAALGFPSTFSWRLARRIGDRWRASGELGSVIFVSSASLGTDVTLVRGDVLSLLVGARATGLFVFAPSVGGGGMGGAGPLVTVEMKMRTGTSLALEGGVLFGHFGSSNDPNLLLPQAAIRIIFP